MAIQHSHDRTAADPSRAARRGPGRPLHAVEHESAVDERIAQGLGWFSVALGVAELLVPRRIARLGGTPPWTALLRACGLRELTAGVGILAQRRPTAWMWSRVAGDALDLAVLAAALASPRSRRGRVLAATAAVAGVTALDVACGRRLSRTQASATSDAPDGVRIRTALTVNRSPDEVYRFWRDFTNLPRVMRHLESVEIRGERVSRWTARGPRGTRLQWEADIVDDRPGELIAWRSLPGGDVDTHGSVRFVPAPRGRGTEVHLDMQYRSAAGVLASLIGRLFGGAAAPLMSADLRPLKQMLEAGQVPSTSGQSSGRAREAMAGGRR